MSESESELLIHDVEEVENYVENCSNYIQNLDEISQLLDDIITIPNKWNINNKWPINLMLTGLKHLKELIIYLYQFN